MSLKKNSKFVYDDELIDYIKKMRITKGKKCVLSLILFVHLYNKEKTRGFLFLQFIMPSNKGEETVEFFSFVKKTVFFFKNKLI